MIKLSIEEKEDKKIYDIIKSSKTKSELRAALITKGVIIDKAWLPGIVENQDVFMTQHLTEELVELDKYDVRCILHPRYQQYYLHYHDFYEIMVALYGTSETTIKGVKYTLNEGDFCLLMPGTEHIIGIFDDNTIVVNVIISKGFFSKYVTNKIEENMNESLENLNFLIGRTSEDAKTYIINLVNTMLSVSSLSYPGIFLLGITSILKNKDHISFIKSNGSNKPKEALGKEIIDYIKMNIRDISLSDIAKKYMYSTQYCGRIIKKSTGLTFKEIVRYARLDLMNFYIALSNEKISNEELSEKCGWSSVQNMRRDIISANKIAKDLKVKR